jgi:DNA-binding transcriptional MerR regulator
MDEPDSLPEIPETGLSRRHVKSESAFRTISEVSEDLDVPQHVLRFWESKFTQIKPLKRGGGRRYYRPEDVQLLGHIRNLLYKDGYTIRGVQKLLRDSGSSKPKPDPVQSDEPVPAAEEDVSDVVSARDSVLHDLIEELLDLRRLLADSRRE